MSISHTTRPPRQGEKEGDHYHFVSRQEFEAMVQNKAFIEWAEVHGNLYGTSIEELQRIEREGKNPLLEIDVQGWYNARPLLKNALSIFILPPTLKVLWQRLESRGSDTLAQRWLRFQNSLDEIKNAKDYDVFLVNHDLETAFAELKTIVLNDKPKHKGQQEGLLLCEKLNEEFKTADWIKGLKQQLGG
jgi:guanylate kinase